MQERGVAVVVGANVLGEGIAADLANAGWTVHLLDTSQEIVRRALVHLRTSRPPLLFLPDYLGRILPATLNDLTVCRSADWVIEAAPDNLEAKRRLLSRLELFVGPQTTTTTTTAFLPLTELVTGCSEAFRKSFLATHFFSPPRYHKLLEVAPGPETDPARVASLVKFAEERLGHRVVLTHPSPGFVANRVWLVHLMDLLHTALEEGLEIELADALTGARLGRPRGLFKTLDGVGLDTLAHSVHHLHEALPDDPLRARLRLPAVVERLIHEQRLGDRAGGGFYRREGGAWQVLDLESGDYRAQKTVTAPPNHPFVEHVLESLFRYVQVIQPQVTASPLALDQAMEWGHGWEKGPFALEAERHRRLFAAPSPPEEYLDLSHWPVIAQTDGAVLRDLGDGIMGFSFPSPLNLLTPEVCASLVAAVERAERQFCALIVANQGAAFCSGFARERWWQALEKGAIGQIDDDIQCAQAAFLRLMRARVPVVGMVRGLTVGGGAELALHCGTLHASPETYLGFTQASVGLIPCFGGIATLLGRLQNPRATLLAVLGGQISTSAEEARLLGRLRPGDTIARNADCLLHEARQKALRLSERFVLPAEPELPCGDASALRGEMHCLHQEGRITAHEYRLAEAVIDVLCGGPMEAEAIRERERHACLALCQEPLSQARLRHWVETGLVLRN